MHGVTMKIENENIFVCFVTSGFKKITNKHNSIDKILVHVLGGLK
jgi:hypothetical protein